MNINTIMLTDPAREIAELFTALQSGSGKVSGSKYLSEKFEVTEWSSDFYRIISTIMDRLIYLQKIVENLDIDEDYKFEMVSHINEVSMAFSASALQNAWASFGAEKVSAANVQPIKILSPLVRQNFSYRKLSQEELSELILTVEELLGWLNDHQISQQEFIRQSLVEGLEQLRFRLQKLQWLGWGYTLESLKEVIAAYMFLERQDLPANRNPDAEAALMKVGAAIKVVYEKIQVAKTAAETGDWLLKAYGAAALAQQAYPSIRGLLTNG